jgi:predicted alpha/beta-hydrolase family hydrolase
MTQRGDMIFDGPDDGATIILAHGAGAPMDHPFMTYHAEALGQAGFRVVRFEFPYMWQRRIDGKKRPPNKGEVLAETWRQVDSRVGASPVIIGGKSMGGRFASMLADELGARACLCLGYPFHPPGKPENLRTAHLETLRTPTLILQGSRDPMGTREAVEQITLSPAVQIHWAEDGNHDLAPRKMSGRTTEQNWQEATQAIVDFIEAL